jgi:hypothetical protein
VHENICRILGIQNCKCSPYRPSSNGQIESSSDDQRCNRKNGRSKSAKLGWGGTVHSFAYNTAVNSTTTFSPFYLMLMREPMVNIQLLLDNPSEDLPTNLDEFTKDQYNRMRSAFALGENMRYSFQRIKKRYDHRVKSVVFLIGQFVWYYCPR